MLTAIKIITLKLRTKFLYLEMNVFNVVTLCLLKNCSCSLSVHRDAEVASLVLLALSPKE